MSVPWLLIELGTLWFVVGEAFIRPICLTIISYQYFFNYKTEGVYVAIADAIYFLQPVYFRLWIIDDD